jgi:hypothetical protein
MAWRTMQLLQYVTSFLDPEESCRCSIRLTASETLLRNNVCVSVLNVETRNGLHKILAVTLVLCLRDNRDYSVVGSENSITTNIMFRSVFLWEIRVASFSARICLQHSVISIRKCA